MTHSAKYEATIPRPGFRIWLQEMWFQHREEVLQVTGKPCDYDLGLYFNKYKWWLKKLYKETHRG